MRCSRLDYETTNWRRGALQVDTGLGTILTAKRILSENILIMPNTNNENVFIQSQSGHTFHNLSNTKEMSYRTELTISPM